MIVQAGNPTQAAGLHYSGRSGVPRTNWGHVLTSLLDEPDLQTGTPLRDVLRQFDAVFDPRLD